jgi:hypothetical protein
MDGRTETWFGSPIGIEFARTIHRIYQLYSVCDFDQCQLMVLARPFIPSLARRLYDQIPFASASTLLANGPQRPIRLCDLARSLHTLLILATRPLHLVRMTYTPQYATQLIFSMVSFRPHCFSRAIWATFPPRSRHGQRYSIALRRAIRVHYSLMFPLHTRIHLFPPHRRYAASSCPYAECGFTPQSARWWIAPILFIFRL